MDQETFDNVQRIRSNVRRYPDGWREAHPLTGLMYCADCGAKMYVHRVNNGKRVPQYTCSAYSKIRSPSCFILVTRNPPFIFIQKLLYSILSNNTI